MKPLRIGDRCRQYGAHPEGLIVDFDADTVTLASKVGDRVTERVVPRSAVRPSTSDAWLGWVVIAAVVASSIIQNSKRGSRS